MERILLSLLCVQTASAVTHSLKYFYSASSGVPTFPEFVIVGMVDDSQTVYYDSNTQKAVPRQEWMETTTKDVPNYWELLNGRALGQQQTFKANIDILKRRFNQTGGVHVVQRMYGCEWDDESGATEGFSQDGYDGEDFLALDLKNMRWIAPTPRALITKLKWDQNKANLEYLKNYYTKECIDWLKKYVGYGKSTLQRKDPPEVSVFQRSSSSPVTCLATGFYPSGVMISWRKDGKDLHEDVALGETLLNPDGTFQARSTLRVSPDQLNNHKFDCVVDHKSLEKEMVTPCEANGPSIGFIIGVVVGLLVLVLVVAGIVGIVLWKKKNNKGFKPANTSDSGSDNSSNPRA